MKLRALAGNLLVATVSLAALLAILEIAARINHARQPVVTSGEQEQYTIFDPVLGWRNKPGASVKYGRREYQTTVAINSLGFRDLERTKDRAAGKGRILAIGDSFIEGYSVELDESLTTRAQAQLGSQACPVEVMNAGVHAYSTDQEALWFANEGAALKPDVVVVFAYYNDIINNVRVNYWGSPKPLVRVADGRLEATNLPLPYVAASSGEGLRVKAAPPIKGSALREYLGGRILTGAPALYNRLAGFGFWPAWKPEPVPDELRAYKARGQLQEFDEAWKNTSAILTALTAYVRASGGRPVLAYIPARFEISERDWQLTLLRYGIDPSAWDRSLVRDRFKRIAEAADSEFLDLTSALSGATSVLGGEPYYVFDGHWNPRGHAVAAQALVEFLRSKSLLPCGGTFASKGP